MVDDRLSEILKKAKQKEEPRKKAAGSSWIEGVRRFFSQFRSATRLTYIAQKSDETGIDPRIVSYYSPDSPVSEQYRIMRTHLFAVNRDKPTKAILLTSAHRKEGKTLTAVNLAITLAHDSHKKVLLIDADLRKGDVKKILNLPNNLGLADVLGDQAKLDEVIQESSIPNVSVITSGRRPQHPAELLGKSRMKELLDSLKEKYDNIIVDAPPVIPVTDGAVLAPLVDGVVLSVKAEVTRLEIIEHAQFLIQQAKGNILGYVLTNVEYHIPEYIHKYL